MSLPVTPHSSELTRPALSSLSPSPKEGQRWLAGLSHLGALPPNSHLAPELSLTRPIALTCSVEPEPTIWASGNRAGFCYLPSTLHLQPQLGEDIRGYSPQKEVLKLHGFLCWVLLPPEADGCPVSLLGFSLLRLLKTGNCVLKSLSIRPYCGLLSSAATAHLMEGITVFCPQYRGLMNLPHCPPRLPYLPVPSTRWDGKMCRKKKNPNK